MVFPGQGSQSVGMLAALAARYPAGRALLRAGLAGTRLRPVAAGRRRSGGTPECDRIHAAGDAGRGHRDLARLARAGRHAASGGRRTQSRRIHCPGVRARRCRSRPRCGWCSTAARSCSARCRRVQGAMAAILGIEDAEVEAVCAQAAQGEVVEAVNYNSPRAGRDRGPRGGGRARDEPGPGTRCQARRAAAGERAGPFAVDA